MRKSVLVLSAAAALLVAGCGSSKPELHLFTWTDYIDPELVERFEKEKRARNIADFSDVVKKSSLEQALKQAEVDVVGIDKDKVYLVEVAFHENGLQYGGRLETKDRVCKKLLRAYLRDCEVLSVNSVGCGKKF